MKLIKPISVELIFWLAALTALALNNPTAHHFSLCPLANLGFEHWCPGCGLGRSIGLLLHGHIGQSITQHWLGIPALLIILHRIYALTLPIKKENFNLKYKEEKNV